MTVIIRDTVNRKMCATSAGESPWLMGIRSKKDNRDPVDPMKSQAR
jgi:hypothetical protein